MLRLIGAAILILVLLTATGCTTPPLDIKTTPVDRPGLNLPLPTAVKLDDAKWTVITDENIEEIIERLKKQKQPMVFFALTPEGYKALALNNEKLIIHLQQLQDQLAAYKEYYENGKK